MIQQSRFWVFSYGKRNPALEEMFIAGFFTAVEKWKASHAPWMDKWGKQMW